MQLHESFFQESQNVRSEDGKRSYQEIQREHHRILKQVSCIRTNKILQVAPQLKQRPNTRPQQSTTKPRNILPPAHQRFSITIHDKNLTRNRSSTTRKKRLNQNLLHKEHTTALRQFMLLKVAFGF